MLNMDQTPVCFSMHPRKTVDSKGKKIIHVWSSTDDTKRATVVLSIIVSGDKLPLLVMPHCK